jgi:hypothetical protein
MRCRRIAKKSEIFFLAPCLFLARFQSKKVLRFKRINQLCVLFTVVYLIVFAVGLFRDTPVSG